MADRGGVPPTAPHKPGTERRRRAERRGRAGEGQAADWLVRAGWRIVGRRVRTPAGEVDLIARRAGVLAFIEVKARPRLDSALASLSHAQRRRIAAAAAAWLADHATAPDEVIRFDVIAVVPGLPVQHLANAWIPGLDDPGDG